MSGFVDAIRQIGIFMVVAQAVTHLAPGKQYEKYVKLIAGIVVLIQFVSFFYDISEEEILDRWTEGMEKISQEVSVWEKNAWEDENPAESSYEKTVNELEQEIEASLKKADFPEGYQVKAVRMELEEDTWEFRKLYVRFTKQGQAEADGGEEGQGRTIAVDGIGEIRVTVEDEKTTNINDAEKEADRQTQQADRAQKRELAELVGKTLGIGSEYVEVEVDGGL